MDNPEKLAALGTVHKTQDEDKQSKKHNAGKKRVNFTISPHFFIFMIMRGNVHYHQ
jgi:hypothetical protein